MNFVKLWPNSKKYQISDKNFRGVWQVWQISSIRLSSPSKIGKCWPNLCQYVSKKQIIVSNTITCTFFFKASWSPTSGLTSGLTSWLTRTQSQTDCALEDILDAQHPQGSHTDLSHPHCRRGRGIVFATMFSVSYGINSQTLNRLWELATLSQRTPWNAWKSSNRMMRSRRREIVQKESGSHLATEYHHDQIEHVGYDQETAKTWRDLAVFIFPRTSSLCTSPANCWNVIWNFERFSRDRWY